MLRRFFSAVVAAVAAGLVVLYWQPIELPLPVPQPSVTDFEAPPEPEPFVWEAQPSFDQGFAAPQAAPPLSLAAAELNAEALRLGQNGEYQEATRLLEKALEIEPEHPMLLHNLQTMFFNWGAIELQGGDADAAIGPLEESLRVGTAVETLKVLGSAYLQAGEPADAAATLEEAAELAPANAQLIVLLAQAYVGLDRRPEALDLLFRAKDAGAPAGAVDSLIATLSREVDAEWDFAVADTPHFRIRFGDEEVPGSIDFIGVALEDAYRAVGAKLGSYPSDPTPVVLYARRDFHRLTQTSGWAEGVFDGRIKIPVRGLAADDPQLGRVVRHEYTHSIVSRLAGRRCPAWVNEGTAMWAEEEHDGDRYDWAAGVVARFEAVALRNLNASFARLSADQAQLAYAQSYLAIRRLVDRYGSGRLRQLLNELGENRPLEDAFFDVYHQELERFEKETYPP